MSKVILVPVGQTVKPQTDDLLHALASKGWAVQMLRGSSQVDLARSTLASEALRRGFDGTLWIDSDMQFEPQDVVKLLESERPFIAAGYPAKGPKKMVGKFLDDQPVVFGEGGGIIEVQYVGMGFTYVAREVYEAMIRVGVPEATGGYDGQTVWPFFMPMVAPCGDYLSEDYSFCERARAVGYAPHMDTRIKIGHIGDYVYTWDDLVERPVYGSVTVRMDQGGKIGA